MRKTTLLLVTLLFTSLAFAKTTKEILNFSFTVKYKKDYKYEIKLWEHTENGKKQYVAVTKINDSKDGYKRTVISKESHKYVIARTPKNLDSMELITLNKQGNWKNHFRMGYPSNMMANSKDGWKALVFKVEDSEAFKYFKNDGNPYYNDFSQIRIKGVKTKWYPIYGTCPVGFKGGLNIW